MLWTGPCNQTTRAAEEKAHWAANLVAFNKGGQGLQILEGACANNAGVCLQALGCSGVAAQKFGLARRILAAVGSPQELKVAAANLKVAVRGSPGTSVPFKGHPTGQHKPTRMSVPFEAAAFLLRNVQPRQPAA